MKKCNGCGFEIQDDSLNFCPACGLSVSSVNEATASENSNSFCSMDQGSSFDNNSETPKKPKSKKKKVLLICIPIIAVVLIAAIVILIMIFAFNGPTKKIIDATINTIEAESFTFKVTDASGEKVDGKVVIDFDNRDIQFLMTFEDGDVIGMYDGYGFEINSYEYYDYYEDSYQTEYYYDRFDVSEFAGAFFDNWDMAKDTVEKGKIDWDTWFEVIEDIFGLDKSDLKENVEDHVNLEKTSDAIKEAFKLLNDEDWLAENVGFEEESKDGVTYYSFDVDFEKVAKTAEDTFSDCLESSDAEDEFDEAIDELKEMDDRNYKVKAEIALEDDFVKEATLKVGRNGYYNKINIEISDVGSTTFDEDEMQDYLDKCK